MNLAELALLSIKNNISGDNFDLPAIPPDWKSERSGVFVSIHRNDGSLRGCIGTIVPTKPNIFEEVIANAIAAAKDDSRFDPIDQTELDRLVVSVDRLSALEEVKSTSELDPKEYGIVVSTDDGRQGVLLPDLDGIDSVLDQIKICLVKGGIDSKEKIRVFRFTSERIS